MNRRGLLVNETLTRLASGFVAPGIAKGRTGTAGGPRAGYFPDFVLRTHENKPVRFYTDLVKGKIVVINMIYVQCEGVCPGITANLVKVQRALGDRAGRDIFMYSLTLKPDQDSPKALKHYAEMHGIKPGWLFLTGKRAQMEVLRRKLGFFDPDPAVDRDESQHIGLIRFGNEALDRWAACPGLANPDQIVRSILWMEGPQETHSAEQIPPRHEDTKKHQESDRM